MQEKEQLNLLDQKEIMELTKNSRGYTWRIKILELNVDKLAALNDKMLNAFGSEVIKEV